jgi:hypothetical protein
MDSTALILLLLMITFIAVIIFVLFYPYDPRHATPYPVMPQFGPYWSHGGQTNSGLLY